MLNGNAARDEATQSRPLFDSAVPIARPDDLGLIRKTNTDEEDVRALNDHGKLGNITFDSPRRTFTF